VAGVHGEEGWALPPDFGLPRSWCVTRRWGTGTWGGFGGMGIVRAIRERYYDQTIPTDSSNYAVVVSGILGN
jgi:hypothetical protein